jgi:transcription termination/antitermination protein NusG
MSSLPPDGDPADNQHDAERLADELAAHAGGELVADQDLQDEAADLASDAEATGVNAAELIAEDVIAESVEEALEEVTEIAEELAEAVVEGELTEDQAEEALEVVVEELRDEIAGTIEEADAFVEAELEAGEAPAAEAVVSEDELLDEAIARPISPYDHPGRWYVVHTQSGYEKKVKQNLEARIGSMNMEERIHEVVIPMEDVVEFKNGKKVVVQKKVFPGYLLVRCELDEDSWYVIRNTPGVTGFVGQGAKPSPLPRRDVESFLQVKIEGDEVPARKKLRSEYEMGETVRVKEGPFAEFNGEIIEINEDQLKVKVLLNLLGRETPVELEFSQVAKL